MSEGLSPGDSFEQMHFTESAGVEADGMFDNPSPGRSVLRYQVAGAPTFIVVDTGYADPDTAISTSCEIGTAITVPAGHVDPGGRNGAVIDARARFDPTIYDRTTRLGPIIPVNVNGSPAGESLDVVWYRPTTSPSSFGVSWPNPDHAVRYNCSWPTNPDKIVIQELVGSEYDGQPQLTPEAYPQAQLYIQNDKTLPGFNPNDEHALLVPANSAVSINGTLVFFPTTTAAIGPSTEIGFNLSEVEVTSSEVSFDPASREITIPTGGVNGASSLSVFAGLSSLQVSGSRDNNRSFTIVEVTAEMIRVQEALNRETPMAGETVTLTASGFYRMEATIDGPDLSTFAAFETVTVLGSAQNDGVFTVVSATPEAVTVEESVVREVAGSSVTVSAERDAGRIVGTDPKLASLAGFETLSVIGSQSNDSFYTIDSVASVAGGYVVTVDRRLTSEVAAVTLRATGPTSSGHSAVFALRQQCVSGDCAGYDSEPYVLLKYRLAGQWAFKIYQVQEVLSGQTFSYDVEVGMRVPLPYPLSLLGGCEQTFFDPVIRQPYWEDVHGNVYTRTNGEMEVSYYYPLQSSFYAPGADGPCFPWLDDRDTAHEDPRPIQYRANWPATAPLLPIGKTLINSGDGLPEIRNAAAVEVVYEGSSDPGQDWSNPSVEFTDLSLAKLIDPLSIRWIDVDDTDPDLYRRVIDEAPFHLRVRLEHDPILHRLGFQGFLDESGLGDPLLLLNVMTADERDELQELAPCSVQCVSVITELYHLSRNPLGLDAVAPFNGQPDHELWLGLQGVSGNTLSIERLSLLGQPGALLTGAATKEGYLTLAFNNDASLPGLPVSLEVIKVGCGPAAGTIQIMPRDNVFDERLTLRSSLDFGAEPERFTFEWKRHVDPYDPDADGTPDTTGDWIDAGTGTEITIDYENPLVNISDNYYLVHYQPAPTETLACFPPAVHSPWAGDPAGKVDRPVAKLAEGWIKRVVRSLNAFRTRTTDFHAGPTNTYASMLLQAGEPCSGPIPFNGDPANVNSIGLIEAYETVLRRGIEMTLCDACTDTPASNTALLPRWPRPAPKSPT